MLFLQSNMFNQAFEAICDYACWVVSFNGASRLLWLSVLWFLMELVIRIIARKNVAPQINGHALESKDEGSWWLIALSSVLMATIIFVVLHMRWEPDIPSLFIPGVLLMLLGIALRVWAVLTLGKFFTMKVVIFSNHHIVDAGPYAWLRHPSYTGVILATFGFGLASGYLLILIAFMLLLSVALIYRIYIEESALKEEFGEEWLSYTAKTWCIIPWVL